MSVERVRIFSGPTFAYVSVAGARSNPYVQPVEIPNGTPNRTTIASVRSMIAGTLYCLNEGRGPRREQVDVVVAYLAHAADFNRLFPEWAITKADITPDTETASRRMPAFPA